MFWGNATVTESFVKTDFSGLTRFMGWLKDSNKYAVKVGILGKKNNRSDGEMTNAEIGLIHEYGSRTRNIPIRSFLRMPISVKSKDIIKMASINALKLMTDGKGKQVFKNIGIACEAVIQDAFGSRGFGTWEGNRPSTIKRKKSDSPLIDMGFLRKSISSEVIKNG